uniref:Uncharacterized protein n=1 Tax=Arundo donax TaxID=35708 RepID=A0A0A8ZF09_ARUDO
MVIERHASVAVMLPELDLPEILTRVWMVDGTHARRAPTEPKPEHALRMAAIAR